MPYIVGVNPNSPTNPHSALASGGNGTSTVNTYPPQEAHILYGAVVGGPDIHDQFWDIRWETDFFFVFVLYKNQHIHMTLFLCRSDWPQTEVALDYNAPLLAITAANIISNTADPFYTGLQAGRYESRRPKKGTYPCDAVFPCGRHGALSAAAEIAIAVVATIVGLSLIVALGYYYWFRKRYKGRSTQF